MRFRPIGAVFWMIGCLSLPAAGLDDKLSEFERFYLTHALAVSEADDKPWGTIDVAAVRAVFQASEQCETSREIETVVRLKPGIEFGARQPVQQLINAASNDTIDLLTDANSYVTTTEKAMLEVAYLALVEQARMFIRPRYMDRSGQLNCRKVREMAAYLLDKNMKIQQGR